MNKDILFNNENSILDKVIALKDDIRDLHYYADDCMDKINDIIEILEKLEKDEIKRGD